MRHRITSTTIAFTRSYLARPEQHWDDAHPRQLRKLAGMLRDLRRPGERAADVIEELLAAARLRTGHAPAPIYLPNIGSSGSHWLEAMLARAAGVVNCGEVYLPRPVQARLRALPPAEAEFFLHAIYAAHSGRPAQQLVSHARFVNSAHLSRVSSLADLTPGSLRLLLVRHPVDIVMSRTLRKAEYRNDVAPQMDDAAYLERNCRVVERFFHAALAERYDARTSYEELMARPAEALAAVLPPLGLAADAAAIADAVASTSREAVQDARARGEKAPTNLYAGEAPKADPALRERARERLAACCAALGYPA